MTLRPKRVSRLSKELSTLVEDIYALFDPNVTHEPSEENLDAFASNIKELLRVRLSQREDVRNPLRFSALGKPDRQLWYDAHPDGNEEELTAKTFFKFLYGDVIEQLVLFLTKEAGHTVEQEQGEVNVDGVLGHIDAIVDGVVVDVKSASPFGYKKFETNSVVNDDPFGYVAQLSGYADVLTPGEPAAWIAFDKVSGDICVSRLSSSVIKDHEPAPRITKLKEIIAAADPPERCYDTVADGKSGNAKLAIGCAYCKHKRRCHPGLRTFLYSTGPRFLTKVVKTPDVPELIAGTVTKPEVTD